MEEMSQEELWELFPIILEKHNPDYGQWYREMETDLSGRLSDIRILRISHIGSTAVAGLTAKPIVDILLEPEPGYDMDRLIRALDGGGWTLMWRKNADGSMQLAKGYTPEGFAERVYHLHVRPRGDWDELYFRDYLIDRRAAASEYETLKIRLKEQFEHDRDGYTDAKHEFVVRATSEARRMFGPRYR